MSALGRIDVDGRPVSFETAGVSGAPPLLLLHGFPMDRRLWSASLEAVAEKFRVYSVDLPGFGGSDRIAETQPMTMLADWLAHFVDAAGVEGPVTLCGLSMGGYIALEFADRYPDRLAQLVLCDSKTEADTEEARATRLKIAETVGSTGMTAIADAMMPKLVAPSTLQRGGHALDLLRQMIGDCQPVSVAAVSRGMAERRDTTDVVRSLAVPLLSIVGESDALTPPELMKTFTAMAPHGRLVSIPEAGHVCPLEQPAAFAAALTTPQR